eukprot:TRINITY_DN10102_c0_g1_i1.p1 TRINITY_DN10102_c0_g1~~TRINITY_DN10102_c0_g1_i1.p1  ORF type:complete len:482 (+),score=62.93 TRINITY_DN10102_c0_g1_i1:53-1498(+)
MTKLFNITPQTENDAKDAASKDVQANNPQSALEIPENEEEGIPQSFRQDLHRSAMIWLRILRRCCVSLLTSIFILTLVYSPARYLFEPAQSPLIVLIYELVLNMVSRSCLFAAYAVCMSYIFSFFLCVEVLSFIMLPTFLFLTIAWPIVEMDLGQKIFFFTIGDCLSVALAIWLVPKSGSWKKLRGATNPYLQYSLDGTPQALVKGMAVFFVGISLMFGSVSLYLSIDFGGQLVFRILVIPIIIFCVDGYQYFALRHLSLEHMPVRALPAVCYKQFLHFFSRLMISNVHEGSYSKNFIMINIAATILEVLTRASYTWRVQRSVGLKKSFKKRFPKEFSNVVKERVFPARENASDAPPTPKSDQGLSTSLKVMRATQVLEDMESEIRVICLIPLVMYLIHPFFLESPFQTIPKIQEMMFQILVQMAFEFMGDLISLFCEIHLQGIPITNKAVKGPSNQELLKVLLSIFCVLELHLFIKMHSN